MLSVIFKSMAPPVILSLIGPIYFAYERDSFFAVLAYSLFCTALFVLYTWRSIRYAYKLLPVRDDLEAKLNRVLTGKDFTPDVWAISGLLLSIVSTIFLPFLVAHTVVFYVTSAFL